MVRRSGLPFVALDEFYRDGDAPDLPSRFGITDWDSPASWDAGAALEALTALAHDGTAQVPTYSISASRRTGMRVVDAGQRSEEHTSELQSRGHLVCRLLLETNNNRIRPRRDSPNDGART